MFYWWILRCKQTSLKKKKTLFFGVICKGTKMGGILGNPMKSVMEENMKKQFKFQEETMLKQVRIDNSRLS